MQNFTDAYWSKRWETAETAWDLGSVSPPLKLFIDQLKDKSANILIPGSGNAYEAEYLFQKGFLNTHLADISAIPLANFRKRLPGFPADNIHHADFFDLRGQFDIILEQTFFCALHPSQRVNYVKQMRRLLNPQGKLAGLLFDDPLNADKPPFGGNEDEYRALFEPDFHIHHMQKSLHSIAPRAGRELFFIMSRSDLAPVQHVQPLFIFVT